MGKRNIEIDGQQFTIEQGAWVNGENGREWSSERETVYTTDASGKAWSVGTIAAGDEAHAERIARFYATSGLLNG